LNGQKTGNNQLYIVQARPETVHGKDKNKCARFINLRKGYSYHTGIALGDKIATGKRGYSIVPGRKSIVRREILVTDLTNLIGIQS
jgi:pyruvate,water dikinase